MLKKWNRQSCQVLHPLGATSVSFWPYWDKGKGLQQHQTFTWIRHSYGYSYSYGNSKNVRQPNICYFNNRNYSASFYGNIPTSTYKIVFTFDSTIKQLGEFNLNFEREILIWWFNELFEAELTYFPLVQIHSARKDFI